MLCRILSGLALILLTLFVAQPAVQAQRGGGGAIPAGTIYFTSDSSPQSMKADGSGKVTTTGGVPSYQKHGSRWFLQSLYVDFEEHGVDEYGSPVYWSLYDVVAVSETGAVVSLGTARGFDVGYCKWGKDDSFISFTTAVDTNGVVTGGLVVIPVTWVDSSPVAGQPIAALGVLTSVYGDVNLFNHDWSGAGDEVVFQAMDPDTGGWLLYVADFSGAGVVIENLAEGVNPDWSAGNGRIAYSRRVFLAGDISTEIWTVDSDGTSPARVTQATASSSSRRFQGAPSWSPDGTLIVYTDVYTKGSKTTRNVMRVSAAGGTATALTTDGKSTSPRWRP